MTIADFILYYLACFLGGVAVGILTFAAGGNMGVALALALLWWIGCTYELSK